MKFYTKYTLSNISQKRLLKIVNSHPNLNLLEQNMQ
jgi:hypothetical protein